MKEARTLAAQKHGLSWRKITNARWVQSLQDWTYDDVQIALADANLGISYHVTQPSLQAVRNRLTVFSRGFSM